LLLNEETAVMCCLFLFTLAQTIKAQVLMLIINPELKTVKSMFKRIYLLLIVGAALACQAAPSKPVKVDGSNDLQPDEQQSIVAKKIAELISNFNYKKVELNDSISSEIYDRYIKALDVNHNYLLDGDVKEFAKFKTTFDDDLKTGNLANVFYIFNVYQKRYNDRIKFSLSQINNTFDYNKNETFTYERDKLPWIATEADMNTLWTQRVKYDLLNLKLANKDMAKNNRNA
jgi:carboxyl-terminal processing protease